MSSLYGAGRRYGEDGFLYGQDPFGLEFSTARFVAFPVGYGRLRVEWTLPSGDGWTELRIVRSAGGWAEVVSEGPVLVDVPRSSSQRVFIDEGLDTSRFYYYTMFVLVFGAWVPVARTEGLSVHDHAFQDRFYTKYLPETYQDSDESTGYALRRTIEAFAESADYVRSETSTLLELRNPDRVPAQLLYLQAADFGLAYEADLGSIRMRRIIRDAVYIYKRKGSLRGIQALATAVTGWAAEVSYDHAEQEAVIDFQAERVNLVPNPSFEVDLAGWSADTMFPGDVSESRVSGGYVGSWHALLEGTGGPTAVFATDVTPLSLGEEDAFYLYWGQVRVFADTEVSVEPRLVWHLDGGGSATVVGDAVSTGVGGDVEELDDWALVHVSASAPADAVGVSLELYINSMTSYDLHVDAASIERAYDLPEYFDATTEVGGMWGDDPHGSTSYFYSRRLVRQKHLFRLLRQHLPEDVTPRLRYGQDTGAGWSTEEVPE